MFEITYHPDVLHKDLPAIAGDIKLRIKKSIEHKLVQNPLEFGEPLRRTLKGYWKLRVGDYRVVFKVMATEVRVLAIRHRNHVYQDVVRRIARPDQ